MKKNEQKRLSISVGFTLIELLVVIAIIMILVSLLLPTLYRVKQVARTITCASQEKQIALATGAFVSDNNGSFLSTGYMASSFPMWRQAFPFVAREGNERTTSLGPYLDCNKNVWYCPSETYKPWVDGFGKWASWGFYAYNGHFLGGGAPPNGTTNPKGLPRKIGSLVTASGTVLGVESGACVNRIGPPGFDLIHPNMYEFLARVPGNIPFVPWIKHYAKRDWVGGGATWRHNGNQFGMNVMFCDGHVKYYQSDPNGELTADNRMWTGTGTTYNGIKDDGYIRAYDLPPRVQPNPHYPDVIIDVP